MVPQQNGGAGQGQRRASSLTAGGSDAEQAAADMLALATTTMPFGKYAGRLLIDLPEPYVVWFHQKGFPPGRLGLLLAMLYEIKVNGLEYLFAPLRSAGPENGA